MAETEKARVLVVDDEVMIRKMIGALVASLNGEVAASVGDGKAAIESFREFRPGLVLLDLHMPGTSGIDVLRDIMKIDSAAYVVMLTAEDNPMMAENCANLGARDFINKTLGPQTIADRIKLALTAVEQAAKADTGDAQASATDLIFPV